MKHLSPEDCQWLKSVGFPQEESEYIWRNDGDLVRRDDNLFPAIEYFACPSLEELLEWAIGKLKEIWGKSATIELLSGEESGWEANGFQDDPVRMTSESNADPKVAIVKLLRAVLPTPPKEVK